MSETVCPALPSLSGTDSLMDFAGRPTGASSILLGLPGANLPDEDDDNLGLTGIKPKSSPLPRRRGSSSSEDSQPPLSSSRKVSFADAMGLNLVSVKQFDAWDMTPPACCLPLDGDLNEGKEYSLSLLFTPPESVEELAKRVEEQKLELESIELLPGTTTLRGVICVLNLCFHKAVYIRTSLNAWSSHFDLLAEYMPGSSDGDMDRFSFKLTLVPPFTTSRARVDFCLRYETPGATFWANNNDQNYVLFCNERFKETKEKSHQENRIKKSCLKISSYNSPSMTNPTPGSEETQEAEGPGGESGDVKTRTAEAQQTRTAEEQQTKLLEENRNCKRRNRRRAARLARLREYFSQHIKDPDIKTSETDKTNEEDSAAVPNSATYSCLTQSTTGKTQPLPLESNTIKKQADKSHSDDISKKENHTEQLQTQAEEEDAGFGQPGPEAQAPAHTSTSQELAESTEILMMSVNQTLDRQQAQDIHTEQPLSNKQYVSDSKTTEPFISEREEGVWEHFERDTKQKSTTGGSKRTDGEKNSSSNTVPQLEKTNLENKLNPNQNPTTEVFNPFVPSCKFETVVAPLYQEMFSRMETGKKGFSETGQRVVKLVDEGKKAATGQNYPTTQNVEHISNVCMSEKHAQEDASLGMSNETAQKVILNKIVTTEKCLPRTGESGKCIQHTKTALDNSICLFHKLTDITESQLDTKQCSKPQTEHLLANVQAGFLQHMPPLGQPKFSQGNTLHQTDPSLGSTLFLTESSESSTHFQTETSKDSPSELHQSRHSLESFQFQTETSKDSKHQQTEPSLNYTDFPTESSLYCLEHSKKSQARPLPDMSHTQTESSPDIAIMQTQTSKANSLDTMFRPTLSASDNTSADRQSAVESLTTQMHLDPHTEKHNKKDKTVSQKLVPSATTVTKAKRPVDSITDKSQGHSSFIHTSTPKDTDLRPVHIGTVPICDSHGESTVLNQPISAISTARVTAKDPQYVSHKDQLMSSAKYSATYRISHNLLKRTHTETPRADKNSLNVMENTQNENAFIKEAVLKHKTNVKEKVLFVGDECLESIRAAADALSRANGKIKEKENHIEAEYISNHKGERIHAMSTQNDPNVTDNIEALGRAEEDLGGTEKDLGGTREYLGGAGEDLGGAGEGPGCCDADDHNEGKSEEMEELEQKEPKGEEKEGGHKSEDIKYKDTVNEDELEEEKGDGERQYVYKEEEEKEEVVYEEEDDVYEEGEDMNEEEHGKEEDVYKEEDKEERDVCGEEEDVCEEEGYVCERKGDVNEEEDKEEGDVSQDEGDVCEEENGKDRNVNEKQEVRALKLRLESLNQVIMEKREFVREHKVRHSDMNEQEKTERAGDPWMMHEHQDKRDEQSEDNPASDRLGESELDDGNCVKKETEMYLIADTLQSQTVENVVSAHVVLHGFGNYWNLKGSTDKEGQEHCQMDKLQNTERSSEGVHELCDNQVDLEDPDKTCMKGVVEGESEDNTSTESQADEEMELYMHALKVDHVSGLRDNPACRNKRASVCRAKTCSPMPSITESIDEDQTYISGEDQPITEEEARATFLQGQETEQVTGRNVQCWRELFTPDHMFSVLGFPLLMMMFFVSAYYYDFLACFALYLFSMYWLYFQGEKVSVKRMERGHGEL